MTRDEMISLVKTIMNARGSENDIDGAIELLERNVPHPNVSDLIFYNDLTPEEIVDRALSYKPIQL